MKNTIRANERLLRKIKGNDPLGKVFAAAELRCLETWSIAKIKKAVRRLGWIVRDNALLINFQVSYDEEFKPYNLKVDITKEKVNVDDLPEEIRSLKKIGLIADFRIVIDERAPKLKQAQKVQPQKVWK